MTHQQKKNTIKPNDCKQLTLKGTAEKLLLFAMWLTLALIRHQWWLQAFLFIGGICWLQWGVPATRNKWRFIVFASSFVVAGSIGLIMVTGDEPFDAWFRFSFAGIWWGITPDSMAYAGLMAARSVNGLLALQFLIRSCSAAEGLAIARRLKVPDVLPELMLLAYRYLFGVRQTTGEVMMAQRQRLGYRGFRTSVRSFAMMLTAVFVKSLRLSLMNYQAMTVRGYQGVIHQPGHWEGSSKLKLMGILLMGCGLLVFSLI